MTPLMTQTGTLISCMLKPYVFDIMQVAGSEEEESEEEEEEEKDDCGDMEVSDQGHMKDEVCTLTVLLRCGSSVLECFTCK